MTRLYRSTTMQASSAPRACGFKAYGDSKNGLANANRILGDVSYAHWFRNSSRNRQCHFSFSDNCKAATQVTEEGAHCGDVTGCLDALCAACRYSLVYGSIAGTAGSAG